jgi:hypothetical protein
VSGEGSPEPPGIRKKKPTESQKHYAAAFPSRLRFLLLPLLQEEDFLRDMFPPSLYLSLVPTCEHEEEAKIWSISRQEQAEGEQDRPRSKIDLRAKSIYESDFAYFIMKNKPTEVHLFCLV